MQCKKECLLYPRKLSFWLHRYAPPQQDEFERLSLYYETMARSE